MDWHMEEEMRYATMRISVPPDLKRRMEAVENAVSWSAVAWPALERKVDELESIKERKTLDEVVARLRAAKQCEAEADYRAGEQDGRRWADNLAGVYALRRLERFSKHSGPEWGSLFEPYGDSTIPAHRLMEVLCPMEEWRKYPRGQHVVMFWYDAAGRDVPDTEAYVRGFADGALAAWLAVKEQVEA